LVVRVIVRSESEIEPLSVPGPNWTLPLVENCPRVESSVVVSGGVEAGANEAEHDGSRVRAPLRRLVYAGDRVTHYVEVNGVHAPGILDCQRTSQVFARFVSRELYLRRAGTGDVVVAAAAGPVLLPYTVIATASMRIAVRNPVRAR